MGEKSFHIAMYPWFAMGHITPYMQLANKLAERGHRVSFLLPTKTLAKFESLNLYPTLITLIPITVPHVDGLPIGAETTFDISWEQGPLLMTAMDLTKPVIKSHLQYLKPHFVFYDFVYWLSTVARELSIKPIFFIPVNPCAMSYLTRDGAKKVTAEIMMEPPPGFPESSSIKLHAHEARQQVIRSSREFGSGIFFLERIYLALSGCDAIGFNASKEMEGPFCEFMEKKYRKPVILAGPVVPKVPSTTLDDRVAMILDSFEAGSLVFVCFGSEFILAKDQLHELVLGLELTGLPFLAALKPPFGFETIESALPEGFQSRMNGKGFFLGGWVPQLHILNHSSVGCFVTHCGSGSFWEGLISECQLVLLPNLSTQIITARLMSGDLKVGVEIEKREEDGLFTRDSVCKAVKTVMDGDSEVRKEVRKNHKKWKEFLLSEDLENSYVDGFVQNMKAL